MADRFVMSINRAPIDGFASRSFGYSGENRAQDFFAQNDEGGDRSERVPAMAGTAAGGDRSFQRDELDDEIPF